MTFPDPQSAVGTRLDGTSPYLIDPEENRALCLSTGVMPDASGKAHPIFFYIASQVGMRLTIAELCKACNFDIADGPMLGGTKASFSRPLMTDRPYLVRGEIKSVTRKTSRKLGLMDVVQYELRLVQPDGELAVSVTNTLILPRAVT